MSIVEKPVEAALVSIHEIVDDFHIRAQTRDGSTLAVPTTYQILEPGFRPFRAGKASADELQSEFDLLVSSAKSRGVDLGIEGVESVRKLMVQTGLGIDCSNFVYRALSRIHSKLGLPQYASGVFRASGEVRELHKKGKWSAVDPSGLPRPLTKQENKRLKEERFVPISWVCDVFGKDPEFITGTSQICSEEATNEIDVDQVQSGDLIAFENRQGNLSHVGVVERVLPEDDIVHVDFWHSWHTRDFESGLRRDFVRIASSDALEWSHSGLADPKRYSGYSFKRPIITETKVG